jgi:hypothetical protein
VAGLRNGLYASKRKRGKYKAVDEGYWIFLKPNSLKKGSHKIPSFTSCETGVISLDVHHTLKVV